MPVVHFRSTRPVPIGQGALLSHAPAAGRVQFLTCQSYSREGQRVVRSSDNGVRRFGMGRCHADAGRAFKAYRYASIDMD